MAQHTARMHKAKIAVPVLDRQGQINRAIDQLLDLRRSERQIAAPTWKVEVGDKVRVGAYDPAPVVVEITDEGRIVVIEHYSRSRDVPGKLIGPFYVAFWWFDVLPIVPAQTDGKHFAHRNAWNRHIPTDLRSLIRHATGEELRDNPDYQRGYAWEAIDRDRFIEAVFRGRELGLFIFVQFPFPDTFFEVLDGKQRLACLKDFVQGRFTYQGRYWYEFSGEDHGIFNTQMIQYVNIDGGRMKRSELLEIFLEVNAAGVPQTPEHLDHVRRLLVEARRAEGYVFP